MTCHTGPVLYRRMLGLRPGLPFDRVIVTGTAQRYHRRFKQLSLGRRVRVVAAQTALLAHDGPVNPVLAEDVIHQSAVARHTQLVTGLLRRKRGRRRGVFMALVAHLVCDRLMDVVKENPAAVGAMGVMACSAYCISHRVVHMLF